MSKNFCVEDAGFVLHDFSVEIGEVEEDVGDARDITPQEIDGADGNGGPHGEALEEIGGEYEENHDGTTDGDGAPFEFVDDVIANEETEGLKNFLHDCARHEAFDAKNDDGGDVADDVKDFCGDAIFDAIDLLILLDELFVDFENHENGHNDHDKNDDAGGDVEIGKNEERTQESKDILCNLKRLFAKVGESFGSFFDFIDGVAGVMVCVPGCGEVEDAVEKKGFVVCFCEEGVGVFYDARWPPE